MWKKWITHTLLVEIQNGAATQENNWAVSFKQTNKPKYKTYNYQTI